MPNFTHNGTTIEYLDEGAGDPVVLVHGFASTKEVNWVYPGWIKPLTDAGYRVIALDNRGHGASTKFYETERYHIAEMAKDVIALLDHLNLPKADFVGYSMGARISAYIAAHYAARVRSATLGGMGIHLTKNVSSGDTVAHALEASSRDEVTDKVGLEFRDFAEKTKSDLKALAALSRSHQRTVPREDTARIRVPVQIVVGTKDVIAGSGEELAELIPNSKLVSLDGKDHMRTVGDPGFKRAVIGFLKERP
ncbi:MAG: alpha/beta fold hydrolase [Rhizobiales bacterium]|jgi:pimeloyl-ACP methyl ester carboxylesterase|nr:alpha/beta fold hydrolase [Hyphomicrobiales bacterium]